MKMLIKRLVPHISMVIVSALIIITGYFNDEIVPTNINTVPKKTVVIDAGHGGFDGGAVASDGTYEKDINLDIALKLKTVLSDLGYDIVMTRETDTAICGDNNSGTTSKRADLEQRVKIMAENPDSVFISIHQNKFEQEYVNGLQVFYSEVEGSKELAKAIQKNVESTVEPDNDREAKPDTRNVYVLKKATVPSVIVECGFISNNTELSQLKDPDYQYKLCFSIACGMLDYFGHNC